MKTLAIRYGISDVALAETCRQHDISTPPRKYWVKIKSGKGFVWNQPDQPSPALAYAAHPHGLYLPGYSADTDYPARIVRLRDRSNSTPMKTIRVQI
jgi:hypothetical protein